MNLKDYFEKLELTDIQEFVENQVSEDLNLEFKTANYPTNTSFDLKNFSKCISGFSNSSGGIIVWGVNASQNKNGIDAANKLKPIKNILKFENYLKRNEGRAIVPLVDNIQYRNLISKDDEGYLLIYIPASEISPHMAQFADKHYYKRSGDSFYKCEHFDIIDMLNRKSTPKLKFEVISEKVKLNPDRNKYEAIFSITNIGQVTAKQIVVFVKINNPYIISRYGIDGNGFRGMRTTPTKDIYNKYLGGNDLVLHPETYHEVDKIVLNEIGQGPDLVDLIIEYKIVAEGMKLQSGTLIRKREELIENRNQ